MWRRYRSSKKYAMLVRILILRGVGLVYVWENAKNAKFGKRKYFQKKMP